MKLALSIKIKPLDLEGLDSDELKKKAEDLFNIIVQIETDKYDFEQRRVTQDYELKELKERQKVQLRQKAEDLFNIIVQIETDKYDFEQRRVTQDYELKEL